MEQSEGKPLMGRLIWGPMKHQFFPGSIGKLNRIHAFTVSWDGIYGSRHPEGPWILHCRLTGLKEDLGHYKTQEEAMKVAEKALARWFVLAGVTPKDD